MFEVDFKILNQKATPAIYADVTAAIPSPGFVGRLFVATDSPYGVFRDTGTAWVQVASVGGGGGGSTGVNGLNGTTNIGLGGTLANNTIIQLLSNNLQFTSSTLGGQFIINSFFSWNFTDIGGRNYNFGLDGIGSIDLDSTNASGLKSLLKLNGNFLITKFQNINYGLNLDYLNQRFALGDYDIIGGKKTSIQVDDNTTKIYFTTGNSTSNNVPDLLYAENTSSSIRVVKLGDFGNFNNRISLIIDDGNVNIFTTNVDGIHGFQITSSCFFGANNNVNFCGLLIDPTTQDVSFRTTGNAANGLFFNFNTGVFNFGDRLVNDTRIIIDDPSERISFLTENLRFSGTAIQSNSSNGNSGNYLVIELNGTQYKINLEIP
jgi:hypothetical protein